MPGIKIYRKSKLKTVNTVKVTETQINLEVNPPLDQPSETVATPDNNQPSIEPKPYIVDEFGEDLVPDNFHETYPSDKKGNQKISTNNNAKILMMT